MRMVKTGLLSVLITCFMLLSTLPAYANTSVDKHEGIELTVNINTAGPQELADLLLGVGLKKAKAIVSYREQHGSFKSAQQLSEVKGIGPATVAKNSKRILL